ncbi:MAG: glycosyltransferase family 4 protein [Verrucomicrobia bacterium]|nr:glycosyltransferase family 4 protein [Verrucomicrobiota bacterium]
MGAKRPKVCHVITRLILGGAQENTLYTVELLQESGRFDVTLVTGPALGPEGSLFERAENGDFQTVVIPQMRRAIHPVRDLTTYRALKRLFKRERYDVVHTHSSKAGVLGRLAARAAGVPVVVHTIHGLPFHPYQPRFTYKIYVALERIAARRSDRIISVADAMTAQAVAAGVAASDMFTTIYSGMDLDLFLEAGAKRDGVRKRLGFGPDDLVVGKIARLFHLKGHEYVFEAFRRLAARFPTLKLMLVHDGILRRQFEAQLERMGLRDRVVFTGIVPPDEIPELIAAMDVLVHASLREGLARTLPQALAVGRPVVSFDVDGAREVTLDDRTGCLVAPKDVDGLTAAIEKLLGDAALRARLGAEGRRLVDPVFRKEYMVEQIAALYDDLLGAKKVGRE